MWPALFGVDAEIDMGRFPSAGHLVSWGKRNHMRQLEALGYKVTLEPAA